MTGVLAYNPEFWKVRRADQQGRIRYGGRLYHVRRFVHRRAELHVVEVSASHLIFTAGGETHAAELIGEA